MRIRATLELLRAVAAVTVIAAVDWRICSLDRPAAARTVRANARSEVAFGPTIPNAGPAPAASHPGMVWIAGGEFSMGAQDQPQMDEVGMKATRDSRPIHRVYVDGFYMDKTDVTNAGFAEFVKSTGYVTV